MLFNENLRALREDRDLTQSQVAQELRLTQRKISRLETKATEPTTAEIVQICKFYNVSADYILGFDKPLPFPKR